MGRRHHPAAVGEDRVQPARPLQPLLRQGRDRRRRRAWRVSPSWRTHSPPVARARPPGGRPWPGCSRPTPRSPTPTRRSTTPCSPSPPTCRSRSPQPPPRCRPRSRSSTRCSHRWAGDREPGTFTEVAWSAVHGLVLLGPRGQAVPGRAGRAPGGARGTVPFVRPEMTVPPEYRGILGPVGEAAAVWRSARRAGASRRRSWPRRTRTHGTTRSATSPRLRSPSTPRPGALPSSSSGRVAPVLDVGCGGGAAAFALVERATHVTGADQQQDMLDAFAAEAHARGVPHRTVLGAGPTLPPPRAPPTWWSPTTCCTTSSTCRRSCWRSPRRPGAGWSSR